MYEVRIRDGHLDDLDALCDFGKRHIPSHYRPLLGADAASQQVKLWWTAERFFEALANRKIAVAEIDGRLIGMGERGQWDGEQVIWKLYVHPDHRGRGIGPRLVEALIGQMPEEAPHVLVEVFEANPRANQFYERIGFQVVRVDRHPDDPIKSIVWRKRVLTGTPEPGYRGIRLPSIRARPE